MSPPVSWANAARLMNAALTAASATAFRVKRDRKIIQRECRAEGSSGRDQVKVTTHPRASLNNIIQYMSYKMEVSDMTSIPRQFRRPLLVARNRLIVPFGFAGMEHMKIKALVPLLGLSLLVVSCETTTTRTV